jgi:hypothetical protein
MKLKILMLTILISLNLNSTLYADTGCLKIGFTDYCAPALGSIYKSGFGVVCGKGQCIKSGFQYKCSKEPGGYAVKSGFSVKCSGGCERASRQLCQRPQ